MWPLTGLRSTRPCRETGSDLDDVVGQHAESDPPLDTFGAAVTTAAQAVASLQNADATLASRAPPLSFLEPAALLQLHSLLASGVPVRH